jgi:hypothetical protein
LAEWLYPLWVCWQFRLILRFRFCVAGASTVLSGGFTKTALFS